MSNSNRVGYGATLKWGAIGLVAIIALLAVTWALATSNARNSQQAKQKTEQYADDSYQRIFDTCLYRPLPGFVDCAREITKASEEAQTAQHDLAAQRGMELWALSMFLASVASVIATIVGIRLVWLNLLEARRLSEQGERSAAGAESAARAAQASVDQSSLNAQRELRAYLAVKPGGLIPPEGAIGPDHVVIGHAIIVNVGRSIASDIEIALDIVESPSSDWGDEPFEGLAKNAGVLLPQVDMTLGTKSITLDPAGFVYVVGRVGYSDGFDKKRFTTFCHRYNRSALRKVEGSTGHRITAEDGRYHSKGNSAD
jgi:hypothetical protein